MRERGIIFSGRSPRAILGDIKTQTRRIVSPRHLEFFALPAAEQIANWDKRPMPHGRVGDRLWVRESFCEYGGQTIFRADYGTYTPISDGIGGPWKSPIFMPRAAARLLLEITDVRVQRLQDISEADARAEGITDSWPEIECNSARPYRDGYLWLWESIHGAGSWDANPLVWAITFRRVSHV